jgi:hypothetical protein
MLVLFKNRGEERDIPQSEQRMSPEAYSSMMFESLHSGHERVIVRFGRNGLAV